VFFQVAPTKWYWNTVSLTKSLLGSLPPAEGVFDRWEKIKKLSGTKINQVSFNIS
jgi:hypothetical protein